MGGRFEAAHPPLLLAGGLVGVLGAVIEPLIPAMLDTWQQLGFRCPVALELVGNENAWDVLQPFERLTKKPLGRGLILVLHTHPAVDEAAVIGLPAVGWGQEIIAFVALRPAKPVSAEELTESCHQRLASFKKPEIIHFVEELPKNPLGKTLRRELRVRYSG